MSKSGSSGSVSSQSQMCRRPYQSKAKAHANRDGLGKNGRWSLGEHLRFLEALKLFGKNWKQIEEHIATRTST